MDRSKNWCFTLNNYTNEELEQLTGLNGNKQIKYMIYGKEVGEQGTPHIQGYIMFQNQKLFKQIKKFIPERSHIEKAKGDIAQNVAYCSKDGQAVEYGDIPAHQPGKRTDLDKVKLMIKEYKPLDEIIHECTSFQAMKTAELLFRYQRAPPNQKRIIKWYYGPTGTGKTYAAEAHAPEADIYKKNTSLKWWPNYFGQKVVILDDFRASWCKFTELLGLLDRYTFQVEVKFGSCYIQPSTTHIIITAPYHPEVMYTRDLRDKEDIDQLLRRIDEIKEFNIKYVPENII